MEQVFYESVGKWLHSISLQYEALKGGRHSTLVAHALHTQLCRAQIIRIEPNLLFGDSALRKRTKKLTIQPIEFFQRASS